MQDNQSMYVVSITDNGNGISDENLARLFEPFFTSKRNGMGLGLASTLTILQSHKSSIEVKTKMNQGTTFILRFIKTNKE
ncbi:MAG TPA: HAMP domain-containing sensor histidine kinase, partial [Puia sp.]|nr:HAMP domain-containing sensor histidine kinase [Puia sp.]